MDMFRTSEEGIDWWIVFLVSCLFILILVIIPITIYDGLYIKPIAGNNANDYCKALGFDQYKEFSRIGILSDIPVAIKCEYAERYTDLGIRSNIE